MFKRKTKISFKKINKLAKTPQRVHLPDACFDIWAISKKETEDYIEYGTGIGFNIPKGWVGLIFPRSSVTNEDLMLKNSVGVIDSGYVGEISFRFSKIVNNTWKNTTRTGSRFGGSVETVVNIQTTDRPLKVYQVGDKIGQIMFMKLPEVILKEVDELGDSTRGESGFGSSGKK